MTEAKDLPQQQSNRAVNAMLARIQALLETRDHALVVALDGRCGTGKSTLAKIIAARCGGVTIGVDDFWAAGPDAEGDQRSPREKADISIDWRRIRSEALGPLLADKSGAQPRLVILEGTFSTRPELLDLIDLAVLVETPDEAERRARLVARENEAYMTAWHERWDVAEEYYFANVRPAAAFDLVIENG